MAHSSLPRRLAALFGAACASLLTFAAGPAAADEPRTQAACSTTPTDQTEQVDNFDGRFYRVRVPAGISAAGAPVIVMLHGGFATPAGIEAQSGWNTVADQQKAIMVYPRGSKIEGDGWGWEAGAGSADITHVQKVVDDVRATWCVDPKRIYLSGHSNGGQMASRLACTKPDVFAAGAVYAPAPPPTGCDPARAVSWGVFAAEHDFVVPEPMAYSHVMYWSWENRPCQNEQPDGGTGVKDSKRWSCDAGTEVLWRVYTGGGHIWPDGARGTEIRHRMWQLFQAHPRP